jgi:hypothetical protein
VGGSGSRADVVGGSTGCGASQTGQFRSGLGSKRVVLSLPARSRSHPAGVSSMPNSAAAVADVNISCSSSDLKLPRNAVMSCPVGC